MPSWNAHSAFHSPNSILNNLKGRGMTWKMTFSGLCKLIPFGSSHFWRPKSDKFSGQGGNWYTRSSLVVDMSHVKSYCSALFPLLTRLVPPILSVLAPWHSLPASSQFIFAWTLALYVRLKLERSVLHMCHLTLIQIFVSWRCTVIDLHLISNWILTAHWQITLGISRRVFQVVFRFSSCYNSGSYCRFQFSCDGAFAFKVSFSVDSRHDFAYNLSNLAFSTPSFAWMVSSLCIYMYNSSTHRSVASLVIINCLS